MQEINLCSKWWEDGNTRSGTFASGDLWWEIWSPIFDCWYCCPNNSGNGFHKETQGIIDSTDNELILEGVHYQCHGAEIKSHVFKVTLAEDIEIPANSEMIVPAKMDAIKSESAVTECNGRLPEDYGILVARVVVDTSTEIILIRTANLGDKPQILHKGTVIASGQPVEKDTTLHSLVANASSDGETENPDDLPEYLEFQIYLYGRKVTVRTDRGALRWLLTLKNPEGQMARWLGVLGEYDLNIQHRPGNAHGNADALSRRPCGDCKHCLRHEQREQT